MDRFAHFSVYRLPNGALDCLGFGAMGMTYRARDTELERDVALKVINKDLVHDLQFRERFFREAKAAAHLQHPNIASVLHRGEEARVCFYVMELVPGENLDAYICRVGPLSPPHALLLAHQIALALDAAYQAQLLHRDLKPGNVMLASYHHDNRNPHVKVIDFGLAKFVNEEAASHYTRLGLFGTPGYASPEQWLGREVDHRSDLYSLGATLWFLLTGRPPTAAHTVQSTEAPEPLQGLASFPLPLQGLLLRLLAISPDARPATPIDAANEIQDILDVLDGGAEAPDLAQPRIPEPPSQPPPRVAKRQAARPPSIRSKFASAILLGALGVALGAFLFHLGSSAEVREPEGVSAAPPASEFSNSLGMRFVAVPGVPGLVSVWETRVQDFAAFIRDTGDPAAASLPKDFVKWDQPGFPQTPEDPVVHVSSEDALRFCKWLTQKERDAKTITAQQEYRLPTPEEFARFSDGTGLGRSFSWGAAFPPPDRWANFSDLATKEVQPTFRTIENYRDGFAGTAPVGSFPPNRQGLYDVAGNVWEITRATEPNGIETLRQGAGWTSFEPVDFQASARDPIAPTAASHDLGFRCLLTSEK